MPPPDLNLRSLPVIKPRTAPGVLELLPLDQVAFQRMLDTIRSSYERFGFLPIETPVMELSDVLLTKTGGETERQVYFVQSTGALEKQVDGLPGLSTLDDCFLRTSRPSPDGSVRSMRESAKGRRRR